jgi:hypothetical protein
MKEYRIPQKEKINLDSFNEPEGTLYTYADYLKWDFEEIVELIKGKIFTKAAAPNRRHQEVSGNLFATLFNFQKNILVKFIRPLSTCAFQEILRMQKQIL